MSTIKIGVDGFEIDGVKNPFKATAIYIHTVPGERPFVMFKRLFDEIVIEEAEIDNYFKFNCLK